MLLENSENSEDIFLNQKSTIIEIVVIRYDISIFRWAHQLQKELLIRIPPKYARVRSNKFQTITTARTNSSDLL